MTSKTFTTTIYREGAMCLIPLTFDRWAALSYTNQKEYAEAVEGAKKPETRARRIAGAVATLKAARSKQR